MTTNGHAPSRPGPLVIVGGYGLVGGNAARLLRRRHSDLELVLAGRNPENGAGLARALRARTACVDACAEAPLATLAERPAAVLATVGDTDDRLLVDAMRRGIPFADIDRGGHADVLDATVHAAHERPRGSVLLCGSWISGLTALCAAAAARAVGRAERIEIVVLVSAADRVGDDSWHFSKRWAWPFHVTEEGRRRPVHPLTGPRLVRCADGAQRPAVRVGTLEQVTLPVTLSAGTVETRMALAEPSALWGLVALKRSGALKALERPALAKFRQALLQRSGTGDLAGFTVTAHAGTRNASIEVLDIHGQGHLNGVGAATAAERILGLAGLPLPPGISFPEQFALPDSDITALREAGLIVRRQGFARTAPAAGPLEPAPVLAAAGD